MPILNSPLIGNSHLDSRIPAVHTIRANRISHISEGHHWSNPSDHAEFQSCKVKGLFHRTKRAVNYRVLMLPG